MVDDLFTAPATLLRQRGFLFTTMQKCITCKFWKQWPDTPNYGACFLLATIQNMESALFPAIKPLKDITQADKTFNTGKHFGCVHHVNNGQ